MRPHAPPVWSVSFLAVFDAATPSAREASVSAQRSRVTRRPRGTRARVSAVGKTMTWCYREKDYGREKEQARSWTCAGLSAAYEAAIAATATFY